MNGGAAREDWHPVAFMLLGSNIPAGFAWVNAPVAVTFAVLRLSFQPTVSVGTRMRKRK